MQYWINSQRFEYLTEVNLGSWSGLSTRNMAEDAGCLDIYRFAYLPFSSATHSMWNHIGKYNLQTCINPLHRYHQTPSVPDLPSDIDYVYCAAKYVEKIFKLFDDKTGVQSNVPSSLDSFLKSLEMLEKKCKARVSK